MKKHLKTYSLYQLIDQKNFKNLVSKWGIDRGVTSFSTWSFTCSLITAYITKLGSYREVEETLKVPRSTFGDALCKRSYGFFHDLSDQVLNQIRSQSTSRKVKKAIHEILAIDSSEISVHGSLFSVPFWKPKHCSEHRAAAKLHVVWNVCGEWVEDYIITPGRKNDSPVSRLFKLLSGKTYVFDRAYNDLSFWYEIMSAGSHFVTRLKNVPRNRIMLIQVKLKKSKLSKILFDGVYTPSSSTLRKHPEVPKSIKFRHIIYRDLVTGKVFHFVTSDFKSCATAIADIYKKRWAVELLFKWLKGHLNIRYLPVKTPNAVKIQLAVAILVQLLLQLKKIKEKYSGTLWELLRELRADIVCEGLNVRLSPSDDPWKGYGRKELTI